MLNSRLILFVILLAPIFWSSHVFSQSQSKTYVVHQESQPRLKALFAFAISVKYELIVMANTSVDGSAPKLEGEYTVDEALNILLEGSQLSYQIIHGKIRIKQAGEVGRLPKITVLGHVRGGGVTFEDDAQ